MKTCVGCKYADWKKTAAGRLHPSGEGKCRYVIEPVALPAAYRWLYGNPEPTGGYISRKREFKDHCAMWSPEPRK